MYASSHKSSSMKDCNNMLPPSTNKDCTFRLYSTSMICGKMFWVKSKRIYSTDGWFSAETFWVNIMVRIFPSNKHKSLGRVKSLSMTKRIGSFPNQFLVVKEGGSNYGVFLPTNMASCSALLLWTTMEVSGVDNRTGQPPSRFLSMNPSVDSAHLSVM